MKKKHTLSVKISSRENHATLKQVSAAQLDNLILEKSLQNDFISEMNRLIKEDDSGSLFFKIKIDDEPELGLLALATFLCKDEERDFVGFIELETKIFEKSMIKN